MEPRVLEVARQRAQVISFHARPNTTSERTLRNHVLIDRGCRRWAGLMYSNTRRVVVVVCLHTDIKVWYKGRSEGEMKIERRSGPSGKYSSRTRWSGQEMLGNPSKSARNLCEYDNVS